MAALAVSAEAKTSVCHSKYVLSALSRPMFDMNGVSSGAEVTISVTDGKARASLSSFAISILDADGNGTAQLSWSKPTTNTDGTPLTDLAGYRIYYGRLPDAPSETLEIASPDMTSATIGKLSVGTWYFSIATYTTSGVESERTRPVWTSI